jgi:hypothetical protein
LADDVLVVDLGVIGEEVSDSDRLLLTLLDAGRAGRLV